MENWYLPMMMLPGIALLLLSTSNLMVTLTNEINGLLSDSQNESIIIKKMSQLKLLNSTMVLFYVAVALLALSGLLAALSENLGWEHKEATYINIVGIVIFLSGIICLIIYSYRAVHIRQQQFNQCVQKKDKR